MIVDNGSRFACQCGLCDGGVGKCSKLVDAFVEGFTSELSYWTESQRGNACASGGPEDGEARFKIRRSIPGIPNPFLSFSSFSAWNVTIPLTRLS